jgi:glycosyltransferase involved in cell wall biosynthesis
LNTGTASGRDEMLIGLDGIPLTFPKTGVGHYTAQLAHALAAIAPEHEFRLVYPSTFPAASFQFDSSPPQNLGFVRVPVGPIRKHWWSVGLPRYISKERIQLFHGTNYDVPLWRGCRTVLTIHDLSLLLHPETHERRSVVRAKRRLPVMTKAADAIVVPTDAIRQEVCEHLRVAEQKVFVVPEAAREFFHAVDFAKTKATRDGLGIGDEFVLTVGTIEPRKNIPTLVAAFERLLARDSARQLQLVIAGGKGWLAGPSFAAIENSRAAAQIVLTGYLQDEALRDLYSSCRVFVYASLYEGFGLPPLEAMACGAPVIVSDIPALVESTRGAARIASARDPDELAQAMGDVLSDNDERAELIDAGRRRVRELSWTQTAIKTMQIYDSLV